MVIRDIKQRKQLSPWILYGEIKENFRFAENIRALTNFQVKFNIFCKNYIVRVLSSTAA